MEIEVPDWGTDPSVAAVFSSVVVSDGVNVSNTKKKNNNKKRSKATGSSKSEVSQSSVNGGADNEDKASASTEAKMSKKQQRKQEKSNSIEKTPAAAVPLVKTPPESKKLGKDKAKKEQMRASAKSETHSKQNGPQITQTPVVNERKEKTKKDKVKLSAKLEPHIEEERPQSSTQTPVVSGPESRGQKRTAAQQQQDNKRSKLMKLVAQHQRVQESAEDKEKHQAKSGPTPRSTQSSNADQVGNNAHKNSTKESVFGKRNTSKKSAKAQPQNGKREPTIAGKTDSLRRKLDGARFRWLNEQLYTTDSTEAVRLVGNDPALFDLYHKGFRSQVDSWPTNPVDEMIEYVNRLPKKMLIGDFGCGEAKLSISVPHKVHSFDLVAANEHVVACDIANVPLKDNTLDVVLFSLALMGTNYPDFLAEAWRVLKPKGTLRIAEVTSRIKSSKDFVKLLEGLGFDIVDMDDSNTHFIMFEFTKNGSQTPNVDALPLAPENVLKPCLYRRR